MKIKFIKPSELDTDLKAQIHKTGKLGFSIAAERALGLKLGCGAAIGVNGEDENDNCLYVVLKQQCGKDDFKVARAGQYFYINTKHLFDSLKIDYLSNNVSFKIKKETIDGQAIYKFIMQKGRSRILDQKQTA